MARQLLTQKGHSGAAPPHAHGPDNTLLFSRWGDLTGTSWGSESGLFTATWTWDRCGLWLPVQGTGPMRRSLLSRKKPISDFSSFSNKIPNNRNTTQLQEGRGYSGAWFEGTAHYGGKFRVTHGSHGQEAKRDQYWGSAFFVPLMKSRTPDHGLVLPIFRVGFPTSANSIQKILPRYAQRPVLYQVHSRSRQKPTIVTITQPKPLFACTRPSSLSRVPATLLLKAAGPQGTLLLCEVPRLSAQLGPATPVH